MKIPLILLFFTTSILYPFIQDELQAVEATYDGQAGGVYYFVDTEGSSHVFDEIEPQLMEKYDLTDGSYEGSTFMIIYQIVYPVAEDKEEEDDYGECIIVDLELVG